MMQKTSDSTSLIHSAKPRAKTLDKKIVIGLGSLLAFIIIISLVISLSPKHAGSKKEKAMASDNKAALVSDLLNQLPENYSDRDKIKQFMPKPPPLPPNEIPDSVKQTISNLQQQQVMLEQRLLELAQQKRAVPTTDTDSANSVEAHQAKTSGLFFPGISPESQKENNATTLSGAGNADKNSNNNPDNMRGGDPRLASDYAKQNMQDQKLSFLKEGSESDEDVYNKHPLIQPASPYEVQAGTIIAATLLTGINTSLPGEAVAQVRQNIYDSMTGQFLLVPKGSKLLGQYDSQITYGQTRVLIAFTRVIRPDGSSILLSKSSGSDLFGQSGMEGDVNNHWGRILGAATLSTLLSVGAGAASDNTGNNNTYYRSSRQSAIQGGAANISAVGQTLTDRAINIQPTLIIPSGYEFNIIVNKDMILRPYQKK